jgi:hypothetical protein
MLNVSSSVLNLIDTGPDPARFCVKVCDDEKEPGGGILALFGVEMFKSFFCKNREKRKRWVRRLSMM